ncbi:MAG: hypothetical protein IJU76_10345 [Desulfovibrionaceae bacterium]|nr:hypothetical protein [Desulfovibrionaceae bacterium]
MEPDVASQSLEKKFNLQRLSEEFLERRNNLPFEELLRCAERVGFVFRHKGTSHYVGQHPTHTLGPLYYDQVNFQNKKGKAVPYQVKQFVDFLRDATPKENKNA